MRAGGAGGVVICAWLGSITPALARGDRPADEEYAVRKAQRYFFWNMSTPFHRSSAFFASLSFIASSSVFSAAERFA